jgi:hypothetical protein
MHQFALVAVLSELLHNRAARCLWIDAQGSFPAEDAFEILQGLDGENVTERHVLDGSIDDSNCRVDPRLSSVFDRVAVATCFDISSVQDSIVQANRGSFDGQGSGLRFIVIDSIEKLFGDKLSGVSSQGFFKSFSSPRSLVLRGNKVMRQ